VQKGQSNLFIGGLYALATAALLATQAPLPPNISVIGRAKKVSDQLTKAEVSPTLLISPVATSRVVREIGFDLRLERELACVARASVRPLNLV
jgi:hypothetical protein